MLLKKFLYIKRKQNALLFFYLKNSGELARKKCR